MIRATRCRAQALHWLLSLLAVGCGRIGFDADPALDLENDPFNCGTPGRVCPAGLPCSGGVCVDARVEEISASGNHTCIRRATGGAACFGDNGFGQLGDATRSHRTLPTTVLGLRSATQLAGGWYHHCALLETGQVACWGDNDNGQLGDGTTTDGPTPVTVAGITDASAIAAGFSHSCALRAGGQVACWGENEHGQLGDGTLTQQLAPVPVSGLADAVQIAAGGDHSCALTASGTTLCWGRNDRGQLGNGTQVDSPVPVQVVGLPGPPARIAAGFSVSCAVMGAGDAWCWGSNVLGELGDGTRVTRTMPVRVMNLTGALAVSPGGHSCAIRGDGTVSCWGAGYYGQLGDNGTSGANTNPRLVAGVTDAIQLTRGAGHTCILHESGGVSCFGLDDDGQLGRGIATWQSTPVVAPLSDVVAIAAGSYTTCAVTGAGKVNCWGFNINGGIGTGGVAATATPVEAVGVASMVGVTLGGITTCARASTGSVSCWGAGDSGELGDGTTTDRYLAGPAVTGLSDAMQLTSGLGYACALRSTGAAVCWGGNTEGQHGNGTTTGSSVPVAVMGGPFVALGAGWGSTCGVDTAGTVQCWGWNVFGQLGDGTKTDRLTPAPALVNDAVQIGVGSWHACAVKTDGRVQCWGYNGRGELGDGTRVTRSIPADVTGVDAATSVCSAPVGTYRATDDDRPSYNRHGRFTCALRSDGSVMCWGLNAHGQLGDGTVQDREIATAVTGLPGRALAISCGAEHACALIEGGTAACWGASWAGQLGNGAPFGWVGTPQPVAGLLAP